MLSYDVWQKKFQIFRFQVYDDSARGTDRQRRRNNVSQHMTDSKRPLPLAQLPMIEARLATSRYFVERGETESADENGNTALHEAARYGCAFPLSTTIPMDSLPTWIGDWFGSARSHILDQLVLFF
jgi:hypothetical protein